MDGNKSNVCTNEIPIWRKILLTIDEASKYSNIGINKLRDMTNEPSCSFVLYIGKRRRVIKRKEFERYLEKATEV